MKQFLIIVLVWLAPLLAGADPLANADPELSIAFKGGPNAATLAHDNRVNRYGLSGGWAGYLQWPRTDRFSLAGQLELLYTPRGAEAILDGVYLGNVRLHYLDAVIAARPEVRLGPTSLYLLLGGGLNLLVSANKENASGVEQDIIGDLHRIDVVLLGGAGITLRLPRRELGPFRLGTVFLEARHDVGLLETDAVNGGYKNRTSSLMLGLSFVLGGPPFPTMTASPAE